MNQNLSTLEQALKRTHWRQANEETRLLCVETASSLERLRDIDNLWRQYSDQRFGFTAQCQIWAGLGGPDFDPNTDPKSHHKLWEFFKRYGNEVGWRQNGYWVHLSSADTWLDTGFPTLDLEQEAEFLNNGCLPFHDVLSSGKWQSEFSPRDCWGEYVWNRWAEVLKSFRTPFV